MPPNASQTAYLSQDSYYAAPAVIPPISPSSPEVSPSTSGRSSPTSSASGLPLSGQSYKISNELVRVCFWGEKFYTTSNNSDYASYMAKGSMPLTEIIVTFLNPGVYKKPCNEFELAYFRVLFAVYENRAHLKTLEIKEAVISSNLHISPTDARGLHWTVYMVEKETEKCVRVAHIYPDGAECRMLYCESTYFVNIEPDLKLKRWKGMRVRYEDKIREGIGDVAEGYTTPIAKEKTEEEIEEEIEEAMFERVAKFEHDLEEPPQEFVWKAAKVKKGKGKGQQKKQQGQQAALTNDRRIITKTTWKQHGDLEDSEHGARRS